MILGKSKKIREVRKRRPDGVAPSATNLVDETMEYFLYNERGVGGASLQGIKIAVDTIAFLSIRINRSKQKFNFIVFT